MSLRDDRLSSFNFASELRSYRNHLGKLSLGPLIKLVLYQDMKNHSPYSLYQ